MKRHFKIIMLLFALLILFNGCATGNNEMENSSTSKLENANQTPIPTPEQTPIPKTPEEIIKEQFNNFKPIINQGLNVPESAEYCDLSKLAIIKLYDDTYEVCGVLKAENKMGGTVDQGFELNLKILPDETVELIGGVKYPSASTYNVIYDIYNILKETSEHLSADELRQALREENVYVKRIETKPSDGSNFSFDEIHSYVYNGTEDTIVQFKVVFAAWDKNNKPIWLENTKFTTFSDGTLIKLADGDSLEIKPNDYYGAALYISNLENIENVEAIITSYKTSNGDEWTNPYFNDFIYNFYGQEYQEPTIKFDEDTGNTSFEDFPIQIVSTKLEYSRIGTPELYIRVENVSDVDIDAFDFVAACYNVYDEPVKGTFSNEADGTYQHLIKVGEMSDKNSMWSMYQFDTATKVDVVITRCHDVEGNTYTLKESDYEKATVRVEGEK